MDERCWHGTGANPFMSALMTLSRLELGRDPNHLTPRLFASLWKKEQQRWNMHPEMDQMFEEGEEEHMNKTWKGPERENTENVWSIPGAKEMPLNVIPAPSPSMGQQGITMDGVLALEGPSLLHLASRPCYYMPWREGTGLCEWTQWAEMTGHRVLWSLCILGPCPRIWREQDERWRSCKDRQEVIKLLSLSTFNN